MATGSVGMAPERNFKSKRFISCEYAGTKAYRVRVITHTYAHTQTEREGDRLTVSGRDDDVLAT